MIVNVLCKGKGINMANTEEMQKQIQKKTIAFFKEQLSRLYLMCNKPNLIQKPSFFAPNGEKIHFSASARN